jgi:FkbM family methyltransferase
MSDQGGRARERGVSILRLISWVGGVVPGWFLVVADPVFARLHGRQGVAEVRHAGLSIELDLADYLQRKVYLRSFERRELRFLRRWLGTGDLAVDVGANVGVLAMAMASAVGPDGRVLAIEPLDRNAATLRGWCRSNAIDWVEVLEAAASSATGVVTLGLPETSTGFASTGHYSAGHTGMSIQVNTVTLDDEVAARFGGRRVRLLKVDVEGMEAEVLAGASQILEAGDVDAVMFEMNADSPDPSAAARVLMAYGYTLHRVGPGGRIGGAVRVRRKPARKGLIARNVIAIRPQGEHPPTVRLPRASA